MYFTFLRCEFLFLHFQFLNLLFFMIMIFFLLKRLISFALCILYLFEIFESRVLVFHIDLQSFSCNVNDIKVEEYQQEFHFVFS